MAQASVSGTTLRGTSAVTYHTGQGTYFAFHDDGNAVTAYKITATNPPGVVSAWSRVRVVEARRGSQQRMAPTTPLFGSLACKATSGSMVTMQILAPLYTQVVAQMS